ncbi:phage integrase N-terminal SAM-like domain-containing protein [Pseudoalteromonas luteoviolacea]|uniref:phage integrase N-terminal SAM-like domain-containing protein n=1 Tax=Pseudoalteromonas luteoviolacea TaxID=43657 RepID=UPI00210FB2CF|nr:phage integrase N-terminal SAM-like domain-containing protein [Pseudoalteromonas luteoviolacea]
MRFHNLLSPKTLGSRLWGSFFSHLANQQNVAANTQVQALNALTDMYKESIKQPLSLSFQFYKSHRQQKLPVMLTEREVAAQLAHCPHQHLLAVSLLYDSGLRLIEVLGLRLQEGNIESVFNGYTYKIERVTTIYLCLSHLVFHLVLFGFVTQNFAPLYS